MTLRTLEECEAAIQACREALREAVDAGDRARARALRADGRGLVARRRALEAWHRECPKLWALDAPPAEVDAAIHRDLWAWCEVPTAGWALLSGPTGAGKSTAAAVALREVLLGGWSGTVGWHSARELAHAARMWPLGEGEAPLLSRARRVGLLVIDDLGLERDPLDLIDILHDRYDGMRPTWVTTGLSVAGLEARYGDAVVRRLTEGAAVVVVGRP